LAALAPHLQRKNRLPAQPRLYSQETDRFRVVYYSPAHEYLAPLLIRSLENAARFDQKTFGYRPKGKVTVMIQDFEDFGYGSAGSLPTNFIQIGIAPFNLVFETLPSAERMGLMANHELMHIVIGDKPARRDARRQRSVRDREGLIESRRRRQPVVDGGLRNPRRQIRHRDGVLRASVHEQKNDAHRCRKPSFDLHHADNSF